MNSIHNNGKDNKSLDQDLEELDLRYQSVEADEPPELLDQAILNRAHRAVEAKNSWLDFGWIHGLTTVGLVVLTFSVVVSLRQTAEFDPTTAPVSDKSLRSQNRQNVSEVSAELKAKKDAEADAGYQLSEKIATPASEETSVELMDRSEDRLEKQRKLQADQKFSDDAPAGQAASPEPAAALLVPPPPAPTIPAASPVDELAVQAKKESGTPSRDRVNKNSAEVTTDMDSVTSTDKVLPAKVAEAESDLNDLDTSGQLDFAQQTKLLDTIIRHKLEGNENWQTELQAFIADYPDYPLPDELKP